MPVENVKKILRTGFLLHGQARDKQNHPLLVSHQHQPN